jgi:hypothetical protein
MSALRAARIGRLCGAWNLNLEDGDGAGDESTGSDVAGNGDEITWFSGRGEGSDRHMRRRDRYEESWFRGPFDRRRGKPLPKRVPTAVLERVSERYREKNFDGNLQHFHEKLARAHPIGLGYSWVKRRAPECWAGSAGTPGWGASQTAPKVAVAGDAVAHRR